MQFIFIYRFAMHKAKQKQFNTIHKFSQHTHNLPKTNQITVVCWIKKHSLFKKALKKTLCKKNFIRSIQHN